MLGRLVAGLLVCQSLTLPTLAGSARPAWLRGHLVCHESVQDNLPDLPVRFVNQLDGSLDEQDKILKNQWDHLMVFPGRAGDRLGLWLLQINDTYFVEIKEGVSALLEDNPSLTPDLQIKHDFKATLNLIVTAPGISSPIGLTVITTPQAKRRILIEAYRPEGNEKDALRITAERLDDPSLASQSGEILYSGSRASVIRGGLNANAAFKMKDCVNALGKDPTAEQFELDMDLLDFLARGETKPNSLPLRK